MVFRHLKTENKALWKKLVKRLKLKKSPTYLDSGSYGTVYDLHNGKVLKLSIDIEEAQAATYFKNNPNIYIAKVYDVFYAKFRDIIYACIVSEKLNELTINQYTFICKAAPFIHQFDNRAIELIKTHLNNKQRVHWLSQLINFFKSYNINYTDFHEGNLLRDSNNEIRIIDFGKFSIPTSFKIFTLK